MNRTFGLEGTFHYWEVLDMWSESGNMRPDVLKPGRRIFVKDARFQVSKVVIILVWDSV